MLRSLSSAVSGLRNQQTKMDVIGNNVSNVNTVAFKAGRVTFKEGFAQVMLSGNLDAAAGVFDKGPATTLDPLDPTQRALPANKNSFKDMSITVYDSLGTKHEIKMVMWKTAANEWDWKFDDSAMAITGNVTE